MEIPHELLACVLGILGVLATGAGLPLLANALRDRENPDAPLRLARGARALISGLALGTIAAGLSADSSGLVWFGVAFLAEELYETGVVILILRVGRARGWV